MISRRRFLRTLTGATAAGLVTVDARPADAEPPPETTTIRVARSRFAICVSPQSVAADLLRGEGFTNLRYIDVTGVSQQVDSLAAGEIDMLMTFVSPLIVRVDRGTPIVMVAGGHVGCFELFGSDRVRTIRDLKGRTVAVWELGLTHHLFVASMLAHVGLDPQKDVNFVVRTSAEAMRELADGKIDAYLAFPPDPQELRANKVGRVVVNSAHDRPWSQYFCCMITGNREFVRKNPVATKRAMRAILKAANLCALEPERVAAGLVASGVTPRQDYALQSLREVPYGKWWSYDAADTVRFYALRLREAGMIKASPQKILAEGTDFRSFEEIRKELKG